MARQRNWRVHGPYREDHHGAERWRAVIVAPSGDRESVFAATEAAARQAVELAKVKILGELTFDEALGRYERYLQEKGNKPRSVGITIERLRRLLPLDRPLSSFSEKDAQRRCEERTRVVAVDTHRNELAEEKTFFKFCMQQRWLPTSPVAGIVPVGRRSRGKPQLHGAEARQFSDRALAFFRSGERGWEAALGNLLVLWLGLRTEEVLMLEVRDVDPMPEGMWLWVAETDGKTDAAKRRLEVPEEIADLLEVQIAHAQAKGSSWLFPAETSSGHRSHTWLRRAAQKICDEAGVKYVPPHGLRGTQSTLALEAGASAHLVAQQLGHTSFKVTERHYLAPGAKERAQSQRAFRVLAGGKK